MTWQEYLDYISGLNNQVAPAGSSLPPVQEGGNVSPNFRISNVAEGISRGLVDPADLGLPPGMQIPDGQVLCTITSEAISQAIIYAMTPSGIQADVLKTLQICAAVTLIEEQEHLDDVDFLLHFGQFGNGSGLKSEIVLTNPDPTEAVTGEVSVLDANGAVLDLTNNLSATPGVDLSQAPTFSIPPLGSVRIETDGQGPLSTGSVVVSSSGIAGGVIRFEIQDIGVAGVGSGMPLKNAIVPVQRLGSINTAIATRNTSPVNQAVVNMILRDLQGKGVAGGQAAVTLDPNARNAQFINEIFPGADTEGFQGTVTLESANSAGGGSTVATLSSVALELGSAGEFTALPVTEVREVDFLSIPSGGAAQDPLTNQGLPFELNFAQFGNGGGLTSEIVIISPEASTGQVALFDPTGAPLDLRGRLNASGPIDDSSAVIGYDLPENGSLRLTTDGTGDLVVGSARVSSDRLAGGVIRFQIAGIGVAGVGAAAPVQRAIVPVQRVAGGINTGLAIRNGSLNPTANITITLRDLQGNPVANGTAVRELASDARVSQFINELFPDAQADDFQGMVTFDSDVPVSAISLELGATGQFTTLPVTELLAVP